MGRSVVGGRALPLRSKQRVSYSTVLVAHSASRTPEWVSMPFKPVETGCRRVDAAIWQRVSTRFNAFFAVVGGEWLVSLSNHIRCRAVPRYCGLPLIPMWLGAPSHYVRSSVRCECFTLSSGQPAAVRIHRHSARRSKRPTSPTARNAPKSNQPFPLPARTPRRLSPPLRA